MALHFLDPIAQYVFCVISESELTREPVLELLVPVDPRGMFVMYQISEYW